MKPRMIERKFREVGTAPAAMTSAVTDTSARDAMLLQVAIDAAVQKALQEAIPKALQEQRERIAVTIERMPTHCDCAPAPYHSVGCAYGLRGRIVFALRSGEIGGEQK